MQNTSEVVTIEPHAVRFSTAARMLDCGVTSIHRMAAEGKLEVIRVGSGEGRGDRRITLRSIKALK